SQTPQFFDALTSAWCFSKCAPGELLEIVYTNASGPPIEYRDIKKYVRSVSSSERKQNAVFIGREVFAENCSPDGDGHPFGCDVLSDISKGKIAKYIGRQIEAKTAVKVRERAPVPLQAGTRDYSCTIKTLKPGSPESSITITGIYEL